MHKLLTTSTAARPTGSPPHRKLFRVPQGIFTGRLVALFKDSASGISLTFADKPYSAWSSPEQIVSDSYDTPFSAAMDEFGNVRIVYTDSAKDIKYLKLSVAAGIYSAGTAVAVVDAEDSYNPYLMSDGEGKLWCMFVNHQVSSDMKYYVRSKISSDDGQTWGSGSSDPGAQLSAGTVDTCFVTARRLSSCIYAVYTSGRSDLNYCVYDFDAGSWGSEISVHSGDYIDDNFDIDVSSAKKLAVVFAVSSAGKIYFKEYDGSQWSGLQEIESADCKSPQIVFTNSVPDIFYLKALGSGYYAPRHARKSGDSFSVGFYSPSIGLFDAVLVYDDSAGEQYEDKTEEASDTVSGDVFHSVSSALLAIAGDALYVGKQSEFYCLTIILSVAGTGGQVVWEYFDGAIWKSFIPASGAFQFDSVEMLIYLWQDGLSAPADWQTGTVNGQTACWIRARVISDFTVNPVGTQIIPAPVCSDIALARNGF